MSKTHFEIIEIDKAQLTVDVSLIDKESMYFNATEQAKHFGKRPDDFWKQSQNREYLDALVTLSGGNEKDFVFAKRGGKYQGTWFHKDLALQFARWLSPLFAVKLDIYIKERLSQEQDRKHARLEAKTGYLPMSQAVVEAHDPVQFYHFSTEANLLNNIVLGMSAKKFKEIHGVDSVRDNLSASQLQWIDKLQRINTGLIEVGMSYKIRKAMLEDHYNDKMRLAA